MTTTSQTKNPARRPALEIHVHLTDGSTAQFVQDDDAATEKILRSVHPVTLFNQQRIVIAGAFSVSAFIVARVTRIDFIREGYTDWPFPPGFSDLVEIPEKEFRRHVRLDEPAKMEKRVRAEVPGDLFVGFLEIELVSGQHVFLALEAAVDLPAERFVKVQYLLSAPSLHVRLPQGGNSILNLGNVARFTAYPGPPATPSDAWHAHHKLVK